MHDRKLRLELQTTGQPDLDIERDEFSARSIVIPIDLSASFDLEPAWCDRPGMCRHARPLRLRVVRIGLGGLCEDARRAGQRKRRAHDHTRTKARVDRNFLPATSYRLVAVLVRISLLG